MRTITVNRFPKITFNAIIAPLQNKQTMYDCFLANVKANETIIEIEIEKIIVIESK